MREPDPDLLLTAFGGGEVPPVPDGCSFRQHHANGFCFGCPDFLGAVPPDGDFYGAGSGSDGRAGGLRQQSQCGAVGGSAATHLPSAGLRAAWRANPVVSKRWRLPWDGGLTACVQAECLFLQSIVPPDSAVRCSGDFDNAHLFEAMEQAGDLIDEALSVQSRLHAAVPQLRGTALLVQHPQSQCRMLTAFRNAWRFTLSQIATP